MEGYRWKAAVITLSDKGYAGEREDKSGPLLCEMITEAGYEVKETILLPDKQKEIEKLLEKVNDDLSNKEKMFILGVIEGLKLSKTAI